MTYEEVTEIAVAHKWAFGGIGREMFAEFEITYLTTPLSKNQMTYLYWMKTGYYERLAYRTKKYLEARKELSEAIASDDLVRVSFKADAVADAAMELHNAVQEAVKVYNNRPLSQE